MRIDRLKISNDNMRDLENLAYLSCKLNIGELVVDIIKTADELEADMRLAQAQPSDLIVQKATVVKGCFECYDFLLRNEKLMEQMRDIFNHFENIPLIEEEKDV